MQMTTGVKFNRIESEGEAKRCASSQSVAAESDTSREDISTADGGSGGTNSCDEADELFYASFQAEMLALQQSTSMLAQTYKEIKEKRRQLQAIMEPDEHLLPKGEKLEASNAMADKQKYKAPRGDTGKRGNADNENDMQTRTALQAPRDAKRTPLQAPRDAQNWSNSKSSNWGNDSWGDDSWEGDSYASKSQQGWNSGSSTAGQWQKSYSAPSPNNGVSEVSKTVANCFGASNVAQMIVTQPSVLAGNQVQEYGIMVQLYQHPGVASPLQLLEQFLRENLERQSVMHLERFHDDSHLTLVHMHMTDRTCWEHVSKGTCPRQSYCRWEHPAPIRYVFSLTLAMPEGQFVQMDGCPDVMLACSSGEFGAPCNFGAQSMPEQFDGEQIQAALNAAQPEYYED